MTTREMTELCRRLLAEEAREETTPHRIRVLDRRHLTWALRMIDDRYGAQELSVEAFLSALDSYALGVPYHRRAWEKALRAQEPTVAAPQSVPGRLGACLSGIRRRLSPRRDR